MGQTPNAPPGTPAPLIEEKESVRKAVQAFLGSWLVSRDLDAAKRSYGVAAFKNEAILQESCAGYINYDQRTSEEARRIGIDKFLQDFLPSLPIAGLSQIINQSAADEMGKLLGSGLMNNPSTDGFVLTKPTREQIPVSSPEFKAYLRRMLPSDFYASFIPLSGGTIYFLWIREAQTWRILHASLICM